MRGRFSTFAVIVLALPLLGMGALGGSSTGAPERNYEGAFVDQDGTRVEAAWIAAGGEMAISGEMGRGTLRISFDDIRTIEFSTNGRDELLAKVSLRKGDAVDLRVRMSLSFTGRTPVGQYRVRARDLKAVELKQP